MEPQTWLDVPKNLIEFREKVIPSRRIIDPIRWDYSCGKACLARYRINRPTPSASSKIFTVKMLRDSMPGIVARSVIHVPNGPPIVDHENLKIERKAHQALILAHTYLLGKCEQSRIERLVEHNTSFEKGHTKQWVEKLVKDRPSSKVMTKFIQKAWASLIYVLESDEAVAPTTDMSTVAGRRPIFLQYASDKGTASFPMSHMAHIVDQARAYDTLVADPAIAATQTRMREFGREGLVAMMEIIYSRVLHVRPPTYNQEYAFKTSELTMYYRQELFGDGPFDTARRLLKFDDLLIHETPNHRRATKKVINKERNGLGVDDLPGGPRDTF